MSSLSIVPRPEGQEELKARQWQALSDHLNEWFYKPDMEAVKLCLATWVAHNYIPDDPVWLFVLGPSGSGKTSIAIRSVGYLRGSYYLDDLGPNSFSSAFMQGKGGKANSGFLAKIEKENNSNAVILCSDLTTTLLSKSKDQREELVGQLRRLYDGTYIKMRGSSDKEVPWRGKITMLGGCTPVLEEYWQMHRDLGERFLYLRWPNEDARETTIFGAKQVGNEEHIKTNFERLVQDYIGEHHAPVPMVINRGLCDISVLLAILRTTVSREHYGHRREVSKIGDPEIPTRISKCLAMLSRASATMDCRKTIEFQDIHLAKRIAVDSIPTNRYKIMRCIFEDHNYEQTTDELRAKTKIPATTFSRILEDLQVLDVITIKVGANYDWVTVTDYIKELWESTIQSYIDESLD